MSAAGEIGKRHANGIRGQLVDARGDVYNQVRITDDLPIDSHRAAARCVGQACEGIGNLGQNIDAIHK